MKLETTRTITGKLETATSVGGRFSWSMYMDRGEVKDNATGRLIAQMAWLRKTERGSDPVDEETRGLVLEFFAALKEAQVIPATTTAVSENPPDKPGLPICPNCGSWCYGDCEANA